jgi:hypothetical protein
MTAFRAEPILQELKDFQRDTVEHAFNRLFNAPDSSRRFLVADEVGLGKTIVARGLVAKAIERLQHDGVERIDIVYICSNAEVADQNIRKLDIAGSGVGVARRLALLATEVQALGSLNLIALTPGTSFRRTSATGVAKERVLLYWLLRQAWGFGGRRAPMNVLQATTRRAGTFRSAIADFDRTSIDPGIAAEFERALAVRIDEERRAGHETIRERFEQLCSEFHRQRKHIPPAQHERRRAVISELLGLLSAAGIDALEPDLVILDEFQRFKHLLVDDPEDEAASLARALFTWQQPDTGEHARVLMLSATPYRAFTVAGDGGDDNHHDDFLATIRFLADSEEPVQELRELLRRYEGELYNATPEAPGGLIEIASAIEQRLSRLMSRTERIGAAGQHDAMVRQIVRTSRLVRDDVRQYLLAQDVAEILGQPDVTELWKSAPYLLNFLDGYKLRSEFDAARRDPNWNAELAEALDGRTELLLDASRLASYADVDAGAPRLRALAEDTLESGAWRLLWVPPALPYHELGGAYGRKTLHGFTKRLVFSAWRAVPRSAAGILSYLAERRFTLEADPQAVNTPQRRSSQRNRLAFTADVNGRLTGMPALALLYPSPTLASAADPREFARSNPRGTIDELTQWARTRIEPLLDQLARGDEDAEPDERWYWAAPLLLDAEIRDDWWNYPELAGAWTGWDPRAADKSSRWTEHVQLARTAAADGLELRGKPSDLSEGLAMLALGGPGVVALRALCRPTGSDRRDAEVRIAAGQVAWGIRALFNSPEATSLLRAARTDSFWREVLRHSIDGDLQAVLDELAHMLLESEGLRDKPSAVAVETIANAMCRALGLRASRVVYSSITVDGGGAIEAARENLHTAYAMRFGDEEGRDPVSDDAPARASLLRDAFNSPFWPFVLISTAVGQEGLDFHPYCHAVVHWNLPTNPVDFEQREGRVHRYKGHAIRKNVAQRHGESALANGSDDPWATAFELAAGDREPDETELVPFWIYPGEATIERHVLALPLSRELDHLEALRDSLAVYRLTFGQARQEDLIDYLIQRLGVDSAKQLAKHVRIDLRPPKARETLPLSA